MIRLNVLTVAMKSPISIFYLSNLNLNMLSFTMRWRSLGSATPAANQCRRSWSLFCLFIILQTWLTLGETEENKCQEGASQRDSCSRSSQNSVQTFTSNDDSSLKVDANVRSSFKNRSCQTKIWDLFHVCPRNVRHMLTKGSRRQKLLFKMCF